MSRADAITRRSMDFRSVDSQPTQLAVPVSSLRALAVILVFSILAAIQLALFQLGWLDSWFPARDYVFGPYTGEHALSVRTYIISFYIAFTLFTWGSPVARTAMALDLVLRFLVICASLDLGSTALLGFLGEPYPLAVIQVIAGLLGFANFAVSLLRHGTMPAPVHTPVVRKHSFRNVLRILAVTVLAGLGSAWAGFSELPVLDALREMTLLGGVGPGVIAFVSLFFLQFYVISRIERWQFARPDFAAPISVIVPAYNEQYILAETIRHIDLAAAAYGAPVEVLILDNASTDATRQIAEAALLQCQAIEGRVLTVPQPGKSHALNAGVAFARHAFVVRIDADTQVQADTFRYAMQNFAHAETGAVGGIPLPPGDGPFDGGRLIEALLKHGFYAPALSAMSGLVGLPGMFVIYRRDALDKAGPFAAGMNGEDTDMSLRIGELGYHTMIDERVRYISEVPTSMAHLREQRLRWFRSTYHVASRARELVLSVKLTVRGKLVLPYMLINHARRAMMVPIVIFGFFQLLLGSSAGSPLIWQSVVAVMIGAPLLNAILATFLCNSPQALLSIPSYIVFRTLRAWFTLESTLTIPINLRQNLVALPSSGGARILPRSEAIAAAGDAAGL